MLAALCGIDERQKTAEPPPVYTPLAAGTADVASFVGTDRGCSPVSAALNALAAVLVVRQN